MRQELAKAMNEVVPGAAAGVVAADTAGADCGWPEVAKRKWSAKQTLLVVKNNDESVKATEVKSEVCPRPWAQHTYMM